MKANEAPEKLYLSKNIYSTFLYQVPDPDDDTAVEYTRTDAFIEKALKFIKTNVDRIVNNQHGVCMGCMDGEFINYMKGE